VHVPACAVPRAGVEIIILDDGETTLRRCHSGFAKSQPGQYRCVRCTPGSFSSSPGALHCRVCPYGTSSNPARTGCGAALLRQYPAQLQLSGLRRILSVVHTNYSSRAAPAGERT